MEFGQIIQVVLSLGIVALALFLSARLARRRFSSGGDDALHVISRQSVSRTQNLVVVETNGRRHLVAFTDGGAHTLDTWAAPERVTSAVPDRATPSIAPRRASPSGPASSMSRSFGSPAGRPEHRAPRESGSFAAMLTALQTGTQWTGLGRRAGSASTEDARP
ncbi:FliO/MopB family protein [Citricoccus sp. GCM10030269]|uniref:FliO/MopB family protein n=1 Tax=Citricoccus sp. GCM10030269 TaxID=3273388 RepID=UPI00361331A0